MEKLSTKGHKSYDTSPQILSFDEVLKEFGLTDYKKKFAQQDIKCLKDLTFITSQREIEKLARNMNLNLITKKKFSNMCSVHSGIKKSLDRQGELSVQNDHH